MKVSESVSQELRHLDDSEGAPQRQDGELQARGRGRGVPGVRLWYTHDMESRALQIQESRGMHERFQAPAGSGDSMASMLPLTEATLQTLVESLPVAIVAVDGSGTILYANRKLTELFGYVPDELIGQSLEMLVPQRLRDVHATSIST